MAKKNVNSKWASGAAFLTAPQTGPTAFEVQVRKLRLHEENYSRSLELRRWCEQNRQRCYVPEWLLTEWGMRVDPQFGE
jgi:hypothetical protein